MVTCDVKFDNNPNGVYYSGQTLSGVVELKNEKHKKIRALTLRIEGFAKCKWIEHKGAGRHRRTVTYTGREDYMNTLKYLVGNYNGQETELSAGLHKFNFSCVLPFNLPTSFESKHGCIRYQIKVELERPWKLDQKYCFGFSVIKVYDLNYDSPALRTPLKAETTKNFFFGLSSKSVYISTEIPTRGFVSGQTVPIIITVNNESNVNVKDIKISLKKIIQYNSQIPRHKTRERVESTVDVRHSGVQRMSKNNSVAHLILPSVLPTNITFCSIIQVSYMIQIVAKVGGMHFSPVVRLPVTIGTVPLQNYESIHPHNPQTNWNEGASSSRAPHASNQDLPPPSYQVAMGMTATEEDDDEGLTEDRPFSPLYPVLNFGTAPVPLNHNISENEAPHLTIFQKGGNSNEDFSFYFRFYLLNLFSNFS